MSALHTTTVGVFGQTRRSAPTVDDGCGIYIVLMMKNTSYLIFKCNYLIIILIQYEVSFFKPHAHLMLYYLVYQYYTTKYEV